MEFPEVKLSFVVLYLQCPYNIINKHSFLSHRKLFMDSKLIPPASTIN
jgi:hypothetical protein